MELAVGNRNAVQCQLALPSAVFGTHEGGIVSSLGPQGTPLFIWCPCPADPLAGATAFASSGTNGRATLVGG